MRRATRARRCEQLARARAAKMKTRVPMKDHRPCAAAASVEPANAFRWTEDTRLELIKGVKLMENNLTKRGQIRSWRAVAKALPQELFDKSDMNRLACIAKKQLSDMRRKYRILKENPDYSHKPMSSKFRWMTKQIMEELDDYEATLGLHVHCELRPPGPSAAALNPEPRLVRGSKRAGLQRPTAKVTSPIRPSDQYYEVEVTLQPGLEDCMSGYDLNVPVELLPSCSESKEVNDDYSHDSSTSDLGPVDDGGDSEYNNNTVEGDVTENDSNDDEPAELLLGEGPAKTKADRQPGSGDSSAAAIANMYTDLAEAMNYFTDGGGKRKDDSFRRLKRLKREVGSASERVSEGSLRPERSRKSSPSDGGSDPDWLPENSGERNQIEKNFRTARQKPGPSTAVTTGGGDNLVHNNDDERNECNVVQQRRRPNQLFYDSQMRVLTSDSGSERELNPAMAAGWQHPSESLPKEALNLIGADQLPPSAAAATDCHRLGSDPEGKQQRGHRLSSADGVSDENPQGVCNERPAACNDSEDKVHETDQSARCRKSVFGVNRTDNAASEEQIKGSDQDMQINHGQTAAAAANVEVIAITNSQSDDPKNNAFQRNEVNLSQQLFNHNCGSHSPNHESDRNSEAAVAAAGQEINDEDKIRNGDYDFNNRPRVNPVDSHAEEFNNDGNPNNPYRQENRLHKKNGSEADSESENKGGRSRAAIKRIRSPQIRSRAHRYGVHNSKSRSKRARKSNFEDIIKIPSNTTKGRPDSSGSESEQAVEKKLEKALKKVDDEFCRLNWWTKHRLFPTGREMINRVVKSANISRTLRLRRAEAAAAGGAGAEFGELIGKCRRKQMGWVIKAEFQQIRLKLAEEMQKTTHIVVQEQPYYSPQLRLYLTQVE